MNRKKKICFVVAAPTSADGFLTEQIILLRKEYEVYLAANGDYGEEWKKVDINDFYSFPIMRQISLWEDLKSVWCLYRYFRRMGFDAVHSLTPKAGLVCALAAFFARVKHRSHTFTGQVWATRKGVMRFMLKSLDWLTAHLDNHIFADGTGQMNFIVKEGVVSPRKISVMAHGSICGVRVDRFEPSEVVRSEKRHELGIPNDKIVYIFLARLNVDKGIYELLKAFNNMVTRCKDAYLLLFGWDEHDVARHFPEYKNLIDGVNYKYCDFTNEPHNMLKASDVFVLPTYREGFGVSVIEASCVGLPVITSDAYGVVDASVHGVTGYHVPVGSVNELQEAMEKLYFDKSLREELGKNGRERILREFRSEIVANAWLDFYHSLLN